MRDTHRTGGAMLGVLALFAATAVRAQGPADGVWRLDFGPADAPISEGFTGVSPKTGYSEDAGFGYVKGGAKGTPFDQNRRIIRDVLQLDDATRDGIYGGTAFRVDVPDGPYHVIVLTGQYSRPGANRPDSHFRDLSIRIGDTVLYEQVNSVEAFYHTEGRYFANYYRAWHPDVDLYKANIARWIPYGEADVAATDGHLLIAATQYAPINALWIYPVASTAGQKTIDGFRAHQAAFFNDQYPYQATEPDMALPEAHRDLLLYTTDSAGALRPSTRPAPSDLTRPLRLFASIGEREAGVVAVTPLKDLDGPVELAVSDLSGSNGAALPASTIDIRYIRYGEYPVPGGYVVRPHFLVPWRPDRMEAELTRGFWVDLHVPDDAQAGFYSGTLTLSGKGVEETLPLDVRILPLQLPTSKLYAGVYAGGLRSTVFRHVSYFGELPPELVARVNRTRMEFYADQGFTGLFDSLPWWPFEIRDGEVVTTKAWEAYRETFRIAKSIPNFSERVFCYYMGGPQLFPKAPGYLSVGAADKLAIDEISFTDEAIDNMSKMVRFMYGEMRKEGLPELVFYVFDELGNHGAKGARWGREMLKAINRCRQDTPGGFRTCVSTLRASVAREYLAQADIVIPNSAYPVTPETIKEIRDAGGTLGLYNMGATRFSYGYYPWRTNAYLRAQWSFSYDGDSRDPYVALPAGSRVSCDCRYTPDWAVLPSIGMLEQREGVDDYRYTQLLEGLVAAADESAAKREAEATLAELREAVNETYLAPENNWDRSTMDYWRWRVAKAAMAMTD